MAKKLLALLLAMCMVFSICAINVFAEGEIAEGGETTPTDETNATEDETVKASVSFELENSYLPNAKIVITGTVEGDVSVLDVEIVCDEDRVEEKSTISVSKFEKDGVTYQLDDATVGAEYEVNVYNNDTDELIGTESFLIRKGNTSTSVDDGSNKVTIWIEGSTNRYIDETVVNLDSVKKPTVLEVAEYVLEEAGREYKSSKLKVTAISSSPTKATYTLKDGATSTYFKNSEWAYILNGGTSSAMADFDGDWTDVELKGGDEIVLFFGEAGKVGYPMVKVTPETIGVKDEVVITVTNQLFDEEGNIESEEPVKSAKVYLVKRGATSLGTAKTTNSDGEYVIKSTTVTSSWITSNQGGKIVVAGYQTTSKPLTMVSVKNDLNTDRDGTVQAWVRIEGAHKTLLERTKSAKIDEFDLYNFMIEVLEDEDIEYETNDDEVNFTYFESKATSGYSNENGDITKGSAWYAVVNDVIYGPDEDLEEVDVYTNDEILFYFGDKDTVPVVYHKVDGELETEKKVYVYFYSDADMTNPIEDLEVNFKGDDIDKDMETNSDGRITLPTVEYRGTYTLSWGEQVGLRDDECPKAVFGEVDLKFTGDAKPVEKDDDDDDDDWYVSKDDEEDDDDDWYDEDDDEDDWFGTDDKDKDEDEDEPSDWEPGDYDIPQYGDKDFVAGPSKYYPDTNIDAWAVNGINKAYEYNLMSGTTYGYFEPQRGITRAEFTTIICRMLGLDTKASYTQTFTDVDEDDWCFGSVMAAKAAGYISGKSETTFEPNSYITREEMAVLVSRIINKTGQEANVYKFADGTSVSAWARIYVVGVSEAGIITGDQFNQFSPKATANRQTAAVIAVRLYEYLGLAE